MNSSKLLYYNYKQYHPSFSSFHLCTASAMISFTSLHPPQKLHLFRSFKITFEFYYCSFSLYFWSFERDKTMNFTFAPISAAKCLFSYLMNSWSSLVPTSFSQSERCSDFITVQSASFFSSSVSTLLPSKIILGKWEPSISCIFKMVSSMRESLQISRVVKTSFLSLGLPLGSFSLGGFPMASNNFLSSWCLFLTCVQAAAQERQDLPQLQVKSLLQGSFLFLLVFFCMSILKLRLYKSPLPIYRYLQEGLVIVAKMKRRVMGV